MDPSAFSLQTMQKRTMEIIEEAFQVWPSVTVKLGYTERMMATNMEKLLTSQIEFPATINTTLEARIYLICNIRYLAQSNWV